MPRVAVAIRRLHPWAIVLGAFLLVSAPAAQVTRSDGPNRSLRPPLVKMSREAARERLRAAGYRTKGGIGRDKTDRDDGRFRSFPHFTSSFSVGGQTFPYTMVGYPPASGRSTRVRSVIIPLRMRFTFFGDGLDRDFEPTRAVDNIVHSPMYEDAVFPNGVGQFGDMMQRATFWNKMDPGHRWHVNMARPRVTRPIDIEVTPETGQLFQISEDPNDLIGMVLFDFMDAEIQTILQLSNIGPDELPIFVTDSVFNEALGYHSAIPAFNNDDGSETLQTFIYTSWFDASQLGDLLADVSTFNHELAEWLNDPFINNIVPMWRYPPESDPRAVCSGNPYLETGDPEGNGPTFDDFPTVVIPLNGYLYHLQDNVLLPWFADEKPSSAYQGWYDFPGVVDIKEPAKYCS